MKNKNQYCCINMQQYTNNDRICMGYSDIFREYYILRKEDNVSVYRIDYCPWCGEKLPKELRDEYFDILKKEYNLEPNLADIRNNQDLPKEFQSDEWWIKRGL